MKTKSRAIRMKIFALALSMVAVQAHAVSAQKLVWEARQQIGRTTAYDPAYSNIGYPMGDVPVHKGVCTDVVVRSLRRQKIDLQQLIHEDMSKNFAAYPKKWGLTQPDRNIDHRRVPNIATYFQRKGYQTHDEKIPGRRHRYLGFGARPYPHRHRFRPQKRGRRAAYSAQHRTWGP